MRNVLDNFGDQDRIEQGWKLESESIARREMNLAALVFQSHVIGEFPAEIVPSDFITHLRERERKVSLGRGHIKNAPAGWDGLGQKPECLPAAIFVGVGITAIGNFIINLFPIVGV